MSNTPEKELFSEKAYIGYNLYGICRRLVIIVFLLSVDYFTEGGISVRNGLVMLSLLLILTSIVMLVIPFYHFRITDRDFSLKPLFRKKVSIPIHAVVKAEYDATFYSRFTNPMFNVQEVPEQGHDTNRVQFYAHGRQALLIRLKAGHVFAIGLRRPHEAAWILNEALRIS